MASKIPLNIVTIRNASPVLFARVVDSNGSNITQASVRSITYSAYLLDAEWPADRDNRTSVAGHTDVAVTVASSVFDTLQTEDTRWDVDAAGYNFRHQLDVTTSPCFAIAGRMYLLEYTITPTSGQKIVVQYIVKVL